MNRTGLFFIAVTLALVACRSMNHKDTIAGLRHKKIEIKEVKIEGGLDKAMAGYQRFLAETPDTALTPEAIRRLADLKIENEYDTLTEDTRTKAPAERAMTAPKQAKRPKTAKIGATVATPEQDLGSHSKNDESETDFEHRATQQPQTLPTTAASDDLSAPVDDLERAGPVEAIALYKRLLKDYPLYNRNDQVLYQMSRAYEELGRIKEAMAVMEKLVRNYPNSRYIDEVQFRRAEYFFTRKRYMDAEDAYATIVKIGVASSYYELAVYKLGWTFYKQELYENALHRFITLLDYKVSAGYNFSQTEDETERKRTEDTFRVISLGFSNLGGADSVVKYFSSHGKRSYEDKVYSNLAEFYFDKRRYADASASYKAFVSRNPFHKDSPNFHMRVIEIHAAGGFPTLVLDAKKSFAINYGLKADYWKYFSPGDRPDVLGHLKTNLTDLANHYHAAYQKPAKPGDKPGYFKEASHWYRAILTSFPKDEESPVINYQLADLLLENRAFGQAAVEYEKTAYDYPSHKKSSEAGYAAVYSLREELAIAAQERKNSVKQDVVRSSLKFAYIFPKHEKAALVLGAAADDLYVMNAFEHALVAAKKLLERFPDTDIDILRAAWLVVGHSSYELSSYSEAEAAYLKVITLLPKGDKTRDKLIDNLAASIYKQGEQANAAQQYRVAADHFLRVSRLAPTSKIRPSAEYDGATALIQLKDWNMAATVLLGFRNDFPDHDLQPEITKKIAHVYRQNDQLSLAANEYERIERESENDEIRQEALLLAAQLYCKDNDPIRALAVYRRYVNYFPKPVDINLETRNKIADILKAQNDLNSYHKELRMIVAIDASAGSLRTDRTRYLAANAFLVLGELTYERFVAIRLVKPFDLNLKKKRKLMKQVTKTFNRLIDYELGETTAAATFYLAEMYAHFSRALMTSERPEGLNAMELEEYDLAIEEQAYPFEEKAIEVHESNLTLIGMGVYNDWIDKSLSKLAEFFPARYAKPEETSSVISSLETYIFKIAEQPLPGSQKPDGGAARITDDKTVESVPLDDRGAVSETKTTEPTIPVKGLQPVASDPGGSGDDMPDTVVR
jgi:TolA-binding protein